MASALPGATEITKRAEEAPDSKQHEVAWIGRRPGWLEGDLPALNGIAVMGTVTPGTSVVHLAHRAPDSVVDIRAAHPEVSVVVDLGHAAAVPTADLLDAAAADVVLVESEFDAQHARARVTEIEEKLVVSPHPVDLVAHAPEATLTQLQGAYIKRFRRFHRLAHPTILFVGPYTHSGGLDVALAAAHQLRAQFEDLRLAAIPLGAVEQRYLDRCEMDALALGHRGIIEWTCSEAERPFWYATATVVCCPWRDSVEVPEPPVLAAAAARPFVGSDLPVFRQSFCAPGAPEPVATGDVDALTASLAPLLADLTRASVLGEAARAAAESIYSVPAATTRLASLWRSLADGSPLDATA